MVNSSRIKPLSVSSNTSDVVPSVSSLTSSPELQVVSISSSKEINDLDSISTVGLEELSYLKLRPFSRLDPTLVRLLTFLNCFGLTFNCETYRRNEKKANSWLHRYWGYLKIALMLVIVGISGEVVYDVNLRQSKLLAEQKRSTPLLTFVIVAYSWLTLVIPVICDLSLVLIGSHLFRFYSRTTSTVCNGKLLNEALPNLRIDRLWAPTKDSPESIGRFFGRRTSVDSWLYYMSLIVIALMDAIGQVVLLGIWPSSIDPYMRMIFLQEGSPTSMMLDSDEKISFSPMEGHMISTSNGTNSFAVENHYKTNGAEPSLKQPNRIRGYLLDSLIGEKYAHTDIGICIKIACLMIQFIHSYAFFMIIISLANHYATAINNINENLDKYDFRRLLKQLIILRDSSEQISLLISIPFCLIIILVFMRQIALNGVLIQSTMLPFENWAASLQSFTCSVSIFMVFFYCDGLQSASKQTHRLKTEQTVVNENRGGNQSIYEFLDYLNRLSKSIRITFFNIIAINKNSLIGFYGHIITLTFVTS